MQQCEGKAGVKTYREQVSHCLFSNGMILSNDENWQKTKAWHQHLVIAPSTPSQET